MKHTGDARNWRNRYTRRQPLPPARTAADHIDGLIRLLRTYARPGRTDGMYEDLGYGLGVELARRARQL